MFAKSEVPAALLRKNPEGHSQRLLWRSVRWRHGVRWRSWFNSVDSVWSGVIESRVKTQERIDVVAGIEIDVKTRLVIQNRYMLEMESAVSKSAPRPDCGDRQEWHT